MKYKLNTPIEVEDTDSFIKAQEAINSSDTIFKITYYTREYSPDDHRTVNDIVPNVPIYDLSIKTNFIEFAGKSCKCTRYYCITMATTKKNLDEVSTFIKEIIKEDREFNKNSTIDDAEKNNKKIDSIAKKINYHY